MGRSPDFVQNPWLQLESRGEGAGIPGARWLRPPVHREANLSLGYWGDSVDLMTVALVGCNPVRSLGWLNLSHKLWRTEKSWQKESYHHLGYVPMAAEFVPAGPQEQNRKRKYMLQWHESLNDGPGKIALFISTCLRKFFFVCVWLNQDLLLRTFTLAWISLNLLKWSKSFWHLRPRTLSLCCKCVHVLILSPSTKACVLDFLGIQ